MPDSKQPTKPNDSELEYLPVECPRCGAKGRLRIERLDRSFTCKGCKRVFHVSVGGILPGERPEALTDAYGALDQFATRDAPPSLIERAWAKVPKDGRTFVGGAICIGMLLICNMVYFWFFSGTRLPDRLMDRAKYVGEAYARNNLEDLQKLVPPDSQEDAVRWLEQTRPEDWKNVPPDAVVSVTTPPKADLASAKFGMATVTVQVSISTIPGYVKMPLYWVPKSKSAANPNWLLDATRTFETSGKKRWALTIPPPPKPRVKSKFPEDPG